MPLIAPIDRPLVLILVTLTASMLGFTIPMPHRRTDTAIPTNSVYSPHRYTHAGLNPTDAPASELVRLDHAPLADPIPVMPEDWHAESTVRIPILPMPNQSGPLQLMKGEQPPWTNAWQARLRQRVDIWVDTTMTHNWRMLGYHALLAAAFTTGPALAATSGPPADSEKLDEIQKQLKEMQKAMTDLKRSLGTLESMDRELASLRQETTAVSRTTKSAIDDIKTDIAFLKSELDKLRSKQSSDATRLAMSPPSDLGIDPLAGSGRVELSNSYATEMAVLINRRTYRLAPGDTILSDPVPAGSFTYEVLGLTPQRTRRIEPNKVFAIHIHPQR